jgi:TfoX/Sxy family transcriptional regulator of competence genes
MEPPMAFDEALADRLRVLLKRKKGIEEKKMFGGIGFLLNGNMIVGVWKQSLIARIDPESTEDALLEPHVRPMDITGKPMKGWLMIEPAGIETDDAVKDWVQRAQKFVGKLPKK